MAGRAKEAAKFLSGVAAHETVGHWWLGVWGRHLLPRDLGWFTFTEQMNWFAMAGWPVVLAALVYYAWIRPSRAGLASASS